MSVSFNMSETKTNLMKAFAGESQARNRYTFGASQAKAAGLHVIEAVLTFTAGQEKEHGEIFYNHLKELAGEAVSLEGSYPVDITESIVQLLRYAQRNEYAEAEDVYRAFGQKAMEEGFPQIASSFNQISEIEKTHGDRFSQLADLMEQGKLFVSDVSCKWMCLNCGHIAEGTEAPKICPVCQHNQGYFIRLELAPYSCTQ